MSMRVEERNGLRIVCGHFYPVDEIKEGQQWVSSCGHVVTVKHVDNGIVYYSQTQGVNWCKDSFSFQCRYCRILEEGEEP